MKYAVTFGRRIISIAFDTFEEAYQFWLEFQISARTFKGKLRPMRIIEVKA